MIVNFSYAAYPEMVAGHWTGKLSCIVAVLTQEDRSNGLFAVYTAIAADPSKLSKEQQEALHVRIADMGQKLPYRHAVIHFPDLKEEEYRR